MAAGGAASSSVVTLNVGGELFQTTVSTLSRAGAASPLSALPSSPTAHFLDRDPDLFSLLLSFLRHGRLPRPLPAPTLSALLAEAAFFALDAALLSSLSDSSSFHPLALRPSSRLPLCGRDPASALSFAPGQAALVAAHGGRLTSFDAAMASRRSALTSLPAVDSLVALSPSLAAAGARDFAGVHLCDFAAAPSVLCWPESASATVLSMASAPPPSPPLLFVSFESARRNASAVVSFDLNSLSPVAEIARKEVFGADIEAAIPATKLSWLPGSNLLLASGSHAGPAGVSGHISLWDVRASASAPVWEVREKEDCFADVTASDALSAVFKVGTVSGEVFLADLRMLTAGGIGAVEPWMRVGDERKAAALPGRKEGSGCRIQCYSNWVFLTRGADVEVWTELTLAPEAGGKKVMRRNWVGSGPAMVAGCEEGRKEEKKILSWAFGGSRMALARANEQCVEVWDSSPATSQGD